MPNAIEKHAVRLDFADGAFAHANLSAVACVGEWLWVASDEECGVERLRSLPPLGSETLRFGAAVHFALADLVDLPGDRDEEADLEGMAVADGYLWVAGSHGLKRKRAKPERDAGSNAKRLAKVVLDANRRLLARLPLDRDATGRPVLVAKNGEGRRAARLAGDAVDNELTRLLVGDAHLGPFLSIPGKENGFDIEGLAVFGDRLLLGLRGPVLRGWAGLLELVLDAEGCELHLGPVDASGAKLRKHFLDLDGLGVRDLHIDGDDLYLLAGPTMVLDGEIRLYRWDAALPCLRANAEPVAFWHRPRPVCVLPHGDGCDRAEAFCALSPELSAGRRAWIALYDSPGPDRRVGHSSVYGDLLYRD